MPIRLNKPHAAQIDVIKHAKRFNVLACGRRWGKTATPVEYLIPKTILGHTKNGERKPPRNVGWFAPSYALLDEAWDRIEQRMLDWFGTIDANQSKRRIVAPNGARVDFWTLSGKKQGEAIAGRGRKYGLVFVDEAAHARYIEDDWNNAIRPTLTDYRGDAWFGSTPKGRNGFHRLYMKGIQGEQDWASFQQPSSNNPFLPQDEIDAAQLSMPKDAFAQEYLAEFLADAANPFGIEAISKCITPLERSQPVVWGVDLAKSTDHTVIVGLDHNMALVAFQRWQSDWMNTIARVEAMVGQTPAMIDATGVGDPIVEQLQKRCPLVEGFKFTMTSKQSLMEGLAMAIQRQELQFDETWTDPLRDELESFTYEYRPAGVRYTAPEGVHDDCVDALALAVMCYRHRPPTDVVDFGLERRSRVGSFEEAVFGDDGWDDV